jgi:putative Mg2+ transporter-C (MgtC) family protein
MQLKRILFRERRATMPEITFQHFIAYSAEAFVLGSLIGAERQWRQRTAGLRTNALVALGAAAFVMVAGMSVGADRPMQIAAQVVSGIGFIGGGVIFREGLTIKGLNTAATLWCSAAVGVLCGSGFVKEAAVAALFVLLANVLLRPVAHRLGHAEPGALADAETEYLFRLQCRSNDEGPLRALLLQNASSDNLVLRSLLSEDIDPTGKLEIRATLLSHGRQDEALERIVSRLSLEPSVTGVSWEIVSQALETE